MATQTVYIVNLKSATRPILEVEAEIRICEKHTWAVVKKRRFLLGASAFFTEKSAQRAKLGLLHAIMKKARFVPHLAGQALHQLHVYKLTGVIH